MLYNFLYIWEPIKATIIVSKSKVFKNKALILKENEIEFLKNILNIISIYILATTKLQADKYPTIYYLIPLIYQIHSKLIKARETYKVS